MELVLGQIARHKHHEISRGRFVRVVDGPRIWQRIAELVDRDRAGDVAGDLIANGGLEGLHGLAR
jgi:hypothetical protein